MNNKKKYTKPVIKEVSLDNMIRLMNTSYYNVPGHGHHHGPHHPQPHPHRPFSNESLFKDSPFD